MWTLSWSFLVCYTGVCCLATALLDEDFLEVKWEPQQDLGDWQGFKVQELAGTQSQAVNVHGRIFPKPMLKVGIGFSDVLSNTMMPYAKVISIFSFHFPFA